MRHQSGLGRLATALGPLALLIELACGGRTSLQARGDVASTGGAGNGGSAGSAAGRGGGGASGGNAGKGGVAGAGGSAGFAGAPARCGNAAVEPGEACDDGNQRTGDGCSPECRRIAGLGMGSFHSCILVDDGSVKCWGYNFHGELGTGNQDYLGNEPGELGAALGSIDLGSGRRVTALAVGFYHSCALLDAGEVKCWGSNVRGQLGLGDLENRGDEPGEMGDLLPAVDLGGGEVTALAAGVSFNCARFAGGKLKCWGQNGQGQLGLGDGNHRGDEPNEMGAALPFVDLGANRTVGEIFARGAACALLGDGDVKCWGLNQNGLLGLGSSAHLGDQPNEMGDALPALDLGTSGSAVSLGLGAFHGCALLDTGYVKCWGGNLAGQLGLEDSSARGDEPGEMGDALPAVDLGPEGVARAVRAGDDATCALLEDWTLRCWGINTYGQLGLGHTESRGDDPGEMGAALGPVSVP